MYSKCWTKANNLEYDHTIIHNGGLQNQAGQGLAGNRPRAGFRSSA